MKDSQAELRINVEAMASEFGKTPLGIVTELQVAAARAGKNSLLEALCTLKWTYWDEQTKQGIHETMKYHYNEGA